MRVSWIILVAAISAANPHARGDDRVAASEGAQRLIKRLAVEDPAAREEAARAIIALGRTARPAVLVAMENSWDPQVRYACQELILPLPWADPGDPTGVAGILANYGQVQIFHRVAA